HEAAFVERTLRNLDQGFEAKTSELVNEALEVMVKQVMRPRLRPVLGETFQDVDYSVTPEDDDREGEDDGGAANEDLVVQRFERGWQAFTLPVKRILTPTSWDKLLTLVVTHLARVLEKRIWSLYGRLTPLGAVRLERDISGIVSAACRGGRYDLREVFGRCVQMCLVVNMEEDEWEEIEKLKGQELERVSGVQWKLDAEE
ncbi:hypothetical protein KC352_g46645, partial [Hortaea werneckii]